MSVIQMRKAVSLSLPHKRQNCIHYFMEIMVKDKPVKCLDHNIGARTFKAFW